MDPGDIPLKADMDDDLCVRMLAESVILPLVLLSV